MKISSLGMSNGFPVRFKRGILAQYGILIFPFYKECVPEYQKRFKFLSTEVFSLFMNIIPKMLESSRTSTRANRLITDRKRIGELKQK